MVIEDIVKSVSTMTSEEITARLREIRYSRTQQKEVTVAKRPTAAKEKSTDNLTIELEKLDIDQIKKLRAMLEGAK